MLANSSDAIDTLIYGKLLPGKATTDSLYNPATDRDGNGIKDIKIYFSTYGYTGI